MEILGMIVGILLAIPLAIFLIRRLAGFLALVIGAVGVLCLFGQQYLGAGIFFLVAFLLAKLAPPPDPDDDYL